MNRVVKFRAWHVPKKRWCPYLELFIDGTFIVGEIEDQYSGLVYWSKEEGDVILVEYTGLKDKNGKEIYEGDILRMDDTGDLRDEVSGVIGSVEFRHSAFRLISPSRHNHIVTNTSENYSQVIGNIYENPELLEAAK